MLWFNTIPGKRVPQNTTYTMAADIASGNGGGSDSAISVADDRTKEKVFEYRSNGITPADFARLNVAVYKWFSTPEGAPYMAWDQGGPGGPFGTKVMEFPGLDVHYYKRKDEKNAKPGKRPGMPSNREIKKAIFSHYRDELFYGEYISHSIESYNQAQQFVHDGLGGIVHLDVRVISRDPGDPLGLQGQAARGDVHHAAPDVRAIKDEARVADVLVLGHHRDTRRLDLIGLVPVHEHQDHVEIMDHHVHDNAHIQ